MIAWSYFDPILYFFGLNKKIFLQTQVEIILDIIKNVFKFKQKEEKWNFHILEA